MAPWLRRILLGFGVSLATLLAAAVMPVEWGFYGHREINRLATFTLPPEMARFYKAEIAYLSAHAVDPDKRRYAAALEGRRHFIDLERFGSGEVESLPLEFAAFHDQYTTLLCIDSVGTEREVSHSDNVLRVGADTAKLYESRYSGWYRGTVMPNYYREEVEVGGGLPITSSRKDFSCNRLTLVDTMMEHGILPYHLEAMQYRLTAAFAAGELTRVLQLSAELGHYIGDATVPLHTTVNYNGQLTGQRGIHSFWESRIPELFAAEEYDVLVGQASYIDGKAEFFRSIVRESHALLDSVLLIEADLRATHPEFEQDCYEERLGRVVRVPCREFARAYSDRLDGMIEERYRRAISAVGSAWYTAWVDGGSPSLEAEAVAQVIEDSVYVAKPGLGGRGH